MGLYDSPIDKLMPQLMGGMRQDFGGTDPDWTALASMYGFRPNPFPAQGQQGQDEMRFLSTLKSIMDQQYNAYGPNANVNSMPNYMYNMFSGMAPLYRGWAANNPGTGVAPVGSAQMFEGGYHPGALPNNQSPLIQSYLSRLGQGGGQQSNVSGGGSVTGSVAGGNTVAQNPPTNAGMTDQQKMSEFTREADLAGNTGGVGGPGAGRSDINRAIAAPTNPSPGQVAQASNAANASYRPPAGESATSSRVRNSGTMNPDQAASQISGDFYTTIASVLSQLMNAVGGDPRGSMNRYLAGNK